MDFKLTTIYVVRRILQKPTLIIGYPEEEAAKLHADTINKILKDALPYTTLSNTYIDFNKKESVVIKIKHLDSKIENKHISYFLSYDYIPINICLHPDQYMEKYS